MNAANENIQDDDSAIVDELPPGRQVGVTPSGQYFSIRVPVDNVEGTAFTFAMALVECYADDGRRLTAKLVTIGRDERRGAYVGEVRLSEWLLPGAPIDRLTCSEVNVADHALLRRITRELVEAYAESPFVLYTPYRRRGAEILDRAVTEVTNG